MPGSGYSTIGLKPSILALLTSVTDTFYPGMFLPSTLIILMNEVRLGRYTVRMHGHRLDLSGKYNTLTIRNDIKEWIDSHHKERMEEYASKYRIKCYSHFVSYFLANLFESKFESQNGIIRLQESDFEWLHSEYESHRAAAAGSGNGHMTFDRFADVYVNNILQKMRTAKEILSA